MVWQCHLLARMGSTGDALQEEVILMTDLSGQYLLSLHPLGSSSPPEPWRDLAGRKLSLPLQTRRFDKLRKVMEATQDSSVFRWLSQPWLCNAFQNSI